MPELPMAAGRANQSPALILEPSENSSNLHVAEDTSEESCRQKCPDRYALLLLHSAHCSSIDDVNSRLGVQPSFLRVAVLETRWSMLRASAKGPYCTRAFSMGMVSMIEPCATPRAQPRRVSLVSSPAWKMPVAFGS